MKERGLKEQIQLAGSIAGVEALLAEGSGYKYASKSTRNKWQRIGAARIKQLTKQVTGQEK